MIALLLVAGSVFLISGHINSLIYSKFCVDEMIFTPSKNTRFIYNEKGRKLYADFIFGKSYENVAVLYIGYGANSELIEKLKRYYISSDYNVVTIYANGFSTSGGNKKVNDETLSRDLSNWIIILKNTFGENVKIFIHGFSYTALSVLNCSDKCWAVMVDNTYLFPSYNYKNIKTRLIKNKSRAKIPEINVPAFFSSHQTLSKETYKLYECSKSTRSVYIYENINADNYVNKVSNFIRHLKQPEE